MGKCDMNSLSSTFFEEYKHLEKICSELYGQNNGVTLYINEMESVNDTAVNSIESWQSDLKWLKRVRHLRNIIAHEAGDEEICSGVDLAFVRSFYDRIMRQTDPLAALRRQHVQEELSKREEIRELIDVVERAERDEDGDELPDKEFVGRLVRIVGAGLIVLVGLIWWMVR